MKKIWGEFEGAIPGLYTHPSGATGQAQPLKYWGDDRPDGGVTTAGLVQHYDGQCGAWQAMMLDVIKVHNITSAVGSKITLSVNKPGFSNYGFRVYEDAAGQNNPNPRFAFFDHAVVKSGNVIYDPSYGKVYRPGSGKQNARIKWEDSSVAWFAFRNSATRQIFEQPDKKGVAEVRFSP